MQVIAEVKTRAHISDDVNILIKMEDEIIYHLHGGLEERKCLEWLLGRSKN